jgi:PIN domain nuclease of toxin-antitoxin system
VIVLDASALLAFLFREPGHEQVAEAMADACISTVNLAETLGRFTRDGHDPAPIARRLGKSALESVPFSATHATICARLLPQTKTLGLSLGDRACLALAIDRHIPVITADREWAALQMDIEVRMIR